jgi:hypothetical protein
LVSATESHGENMCRFFKWYATLCNPSAPGKRHVGRAGAACVITTMETGATCRRSTPRKFG